MTITVTKGVIKGAAVAPARRFEVFTGEGHRRDWSADEKEAIIAESYSGEDSVCGVARRHGLDPGQLFAWRRQERVRQERREKQVAQVASRLVAPEPLFVPAVVKPAVDIGSAGSPPPSGMAGLIEITFDGVMLRIGSGADGPMVCAVLELLKSRKP